jgi:hypothetical protein
LQRRGVRGGGGKRCFCIGSDRYFLKILIFHEKAPFSSEINQTRRKREKKTIRVGFVTENFIFHQKLLEVSEYKVSVMKRLGLVFQPTA